MTLTNWTSSRRDFLRVSGAAVGMGVLPAAAETVGPAIVQTPGGPDRPNIVVVVIDTLRRDHVRSYGAAGMHTPNLDALAAESVMFTRATPEAMPTVPARRTIHTGRRTFPFRDWQRRSGNETGVWGWQHIPDDQPTLSETLRAAGYYTMLVSDTPHQFKASMNFTRGFNVVQWLRGQEGDDFQPYWVAPDRDLDRFMYRTAGGAELDSKAENFPMRRELRQYLANIHDRQSEEDFFPARVFRTAARLLENMPREQPFFLLVDSFDPHEPWDPPGAYVSLYDDAPWTEPEPVTPRYGSSDYLTERQIARMRTLYAGEVTLTDRWLGHFLDRLVDLRLADDTAIILTSDHGHALGEHGAVGKPAFALWSEMTDTPFLLRAPGGRGGGGRNDFFASTHDVAPTALALASAAPEAPMDGVSLLPALAGGTMPVRPVMTTGLNDFVCVLDGRWRLICRNDGTDALLYDTVADPDQLTDLSGREPETVRRLFAALLDDVGGPLPHY